MVFRYNRFKSLDLRDEFDYSAGQGLRLSRLKRGIGGSNVHIP